MAKLNFVILKLSDIIIFKRIHPFSIANSCNSLSLCKFWNLRSESDYSKSVDCFEDIKKMPYY